MATEQHDGFVFAGLGKPLVSAYSLQAVLINPFCRPSQVGAGYATVRPSGVKR